MAGAKICATSSSDLECSHSNSATLQAGLIFRWTVSEDQLMAREEFLRGAYIYIYA